MAKAAKKKVTAKKESSFDVTKLKRNVITLPLFKWKDDLVKYLRIEGKVYEGKAVSGTEGKDMEPANLCQVTNLETGELGEIIVGSVLGGIFEDKFEGDDYVGRMFEIEQYKIEGKRYRGYKVTELSE